MTDISGGIMELATRSILAGNNRTVYDVDAVIHAGGVDLPVHSVSRIDTHSDFVTQYRDVTSITVLVSTGDLIMKIAPFQDDLTVTVNSNRDDSRVMMGNTYRAYLTEDIPSSIGTADSGLYKDAETANRFSTVSITIALVHLAVEYLDSIQTGMVCRVTPPFTVLKVLFKKYLDEINFTSEVAIDSLTFEEPSNLSNREIINIPQPTRLVELPDLLQNREGGIYTTGLGWYLYNSGLYFWPLYDIGSEPKTSRRMHVYIGPTKHSSIIDQTYKVENQLLSIIGTGPLSVIDDTLGQINNQGDTIRYLDGNTAFGAGAVAKDNVLHMDRKSTHIETAVAETGQAMQVARTGPMVVTSNIYRELSKKAMLSGVTVQFVWRYSDPRLVVPGMRVTLFYLKNNELLEIDGRLMGMSSSEELLGSGITSKRMSQVTVVSVFIDRKSPVFDQFVKTGGSARPIATIR